MQHQGPLSSNRFIQVTTSVTSILLLYNIILLLFIFDNHLISPDINRGPMYEEVYRLLKGQPIYSAPTINYVSLAYNPFFILISAFLAKLLGLSVSGVRLTAILGTLGAGIIIYLALFKETQNKWYGFAGAGIFAGAYFVLDAYYDFANADTWMLFCALLGFFLLNDVASPNKTFWGILFLCLSFWFKQQGLILLIAGLIFITVKLGVKRSIPYWVLAGLIVPVSYIYLGPKIFGNYFSYFTYQVPSKWTEFTIDALLRFAKHFIRHWPFLFVFAVYLFTYRLQKRRLDTVWLFCLPFALAVGFLGVLDPGSENNVFLVSDTWLIITGMLGMSEYLKMMPEEYLGGKHVPLINRMLNGRNEIIIFAILLSAVINIFPPQKAIVPHGAWGDYYDLLNRVCNLKGQVYMPEIGQLPSGCRLEWTAHWVPMEDMVRNPNGYTSKNPLIANILVEAKNPTSKTYIITNWPLADDPLIGFLSEDYVLVQDLGDRYASLRGMPGRFGGHTWPRYIYAS